MANYVKRGNTIFITNSSKLTKKEKADIKLLVDLGCDVKISKEVKKPKPGFTKVELIYYLEQTYPNEPERVEMFLDIADNPDDPNFMKAYQLFNKWYKEAHPDDTETTKTGKVKVKDYAGQAAALIKENGIEAKKRIDELKKIEEKKKAKK